MPYIQTVMGVACTATVQHFILKVKHADAGYQEGQMLKNITSWLLSDTVQKSIGNVGLTPTFQNATVSFSVIAVPSFWPSCITNAACQVLYL